MLNDALRHDLDATNMLIKQRTGLTPIELCAPRGYVQFVANEVGVNELIETGDTLQVKLDDGRFFLHAV